MFHFEVEGAFRVSVVPLIYNVKRIIVYVFFSSLWYKCAFFVKVG